MFFFLGNPFIKLDSKGLIVDFLPYGYIFIKTLILNYFDLKYHIQIKTNTSDYIIGRIFSQLTLDNLGQ